MSELEELRLAYAECSKQRNELLNKLKSQPKREWVGLTDDEVGKYSDRLNGGDIAREVEAMLRERNT